MLPNSATRHQPSVPETSSHVTSGIHGFLALCRTVEKNLIEDAYRAGEARGLAVWWADQAGPSRTMPYPGPSWRPAAEPACQPHEDLRDGPAKVLILFHPASGRVRLE